MDANRAATWQAIVITDHIAEQTRRELDRHFRETVNLSRSIAQAKKRAKRIQQKIQRETRKLFQLYAAYSANPLSLLALSFQREEELELNALPKSRVRFASEEYDGSPQEQELEDIFDAYDCNVEDEHAPQWYQTLGNYWTNDRKEYKNFQHAPYAKLPAHCIRTKQGSVIKCYRGNAGVCVSLGLTLPVTVCYKYVDLKFLRA